MRGSLRACLEAAACLPHSQLSLSMVSGPGRVVMASAVLYGLSHDRADWIISDKAQIITETAQLEQG